MLTFLNMLTDLNIIEQSQDCNFGAGPFSDMSYGREDRVQSTEAADFANLLDDIMYSNGM